jgi:uncharacterized protein YciI
MLYVIICTDKPGQLAVRQTNRPDHIAFLEGLGGKLKAAGPFLDDAGDPTGSLVIIEADSQSEAEAAAALDPYAKAGLFAHVEVRPWKWTMKNPEA